MCVCVCMRVSELHRRVCTLFTVTQSWLVRFLHFQSIFLFYFFFLISTFIFLFVIFIRFLFRLFFFSANIFKTFILFRSSLACLSVSAVEEFVYTRKSNFTEHIKLKCNANSFLFAVCLPKNVQCEWLDRQNVIRFSATKKFASFCSLVYRIKSRTGDSE